MKNRICLWHMDLCEDAFEYDIEPEFVEGNSRKEINRRYNRRFEQELRYKEVPAEELLSYKADTEYSSITGNYCAICKRQITSTFEICSKCEAEYNLDLRNRASWPEWVKVLAQDKENWQNEEKRQKDVTNFADLGVDYDEFDESDLEESGELANAESPWESSTLTDWDKVDSDLDYPALRAKFVATLTKREKEVFEYLEAGYPQEEIAKTMNLSKQVINDHVRRIRGKATNIA